jgi:hypothetical protein
MVFGEQMFTKASKNSDISASCSENIVTVAFYVNVKSCRYIINRLALRNKGGERSENTAAIHLTNFTAIALQAKQLGQKKKSTQSRIKLAHFRGIKPSQEYHRIEEHKSGCRLIQNSPKTPKLNH